MRGKSAGCLALAILIGLLSLPAPALAKAEARFVPPVDGQVVEPFNMKDGPYQAGHRGIDYGVPSGSPVTASGAGTVRFAGPVAEDGLFVTIEHTGGIETTYSFLSSIQVSRGQTVAQGDLIGSSGEGHKNSGVPALHFGAKRDGEYINPETLLKDFSDIREFIELEPSDEDHREAGIGKPSIALSEPNANAPHASRGELTVPGVLWLDRPPVAPPKVDPPEIRLQAPGFNGIRVPSPTDIKQPTYSSPKPTLEATGPSVLPPRTEIPTTRDPLEQAAWWDQLTQAEREAFIAANPRAIGRMDGVNPADRNRANRVALAKEIARLEPEVAAAREDAARYVSEHGPQGRGMSYELQAIRRRISNLEDRRRGAVHLQEQLGAVAGARRTDTIEPGDVYLLDYDTGGDGRAVVAIGDPSQAEFVGVVVPGIFNKLDNFGNTLKKAANLRRTTEARFGRDTARKTSTIAWLGYDTPESIESITDTDRAVDGGVVLRRFVNNLNALRNQGKFGWAGSKNYLVSVFGHSYGSTTAAAAAYLGMVVGNLALFGSPGGFGLNAGELKGAAQVWAGRIKGDVVPGASAFQHLGANPMSPDFGARIIPMCCEKLGHGGYLNMRSRSAKNLAAILVGRYDAIE